MTEQHQMIVLTPRRRGRPRATEPRMRLSAWIPSKAFDSLNRLANEKDISISAVVSQILTKEVDFPS